MNHTANGATFQTDQKPAPKDMQRGSVWKKCSDEQDLMEIANPASHGENFDGFFFTKKKGFY